MGASIGKPRAMRSNWVGGTANCRKTRQRRLEEQQKVGGSSAALHFDISALNGLLEVPLRYLPLPLKTHSIFLPRIFPFLSFLLNKTKTRRSLSLSPHSSRHFQNALLLPLSFALSSHRVSFDQRITKVQRQRFLLFLFFEICGSSVLWIKAGGLQILVFSHLFQVATSSSSESTTL